MSDKKTIDDLRARLFAAIDGLNDKTLDVAQAREISALAQVLVNTARVELDHLRLTGSGKSTFVPIEHDDELPNGITGIVRHRLAG